MFRLKISKVFCKLIIHTLNTLASQTLIFHWSVNHVYCNSNSGHKLPAIAVFVHPLPYFFYQKSYLSQNHCLQSGFETVVNIVNSTPFWYAIVLAIYSRSNVSQTQMIAWMIFWNMLHAAWALCKYVTGIDHRWQWVTATTPEGHVVQSRDAPRVQLKGCSPRATNHEGFVGVTPDHLCSIPIRVWLNNFVSNAFMTKYI